MTSERRHDIDWLRVLAIGLLLIYHIAIVFQPWALLIGFIKSEESLEALWIPMTMLNVWRIPLLFYVSGMGLYFAMRKRNWKQLILERAKRILLPFLFGIIAIAPLHLFIFQKYYDLPLSYYPHQGHLWFLGNIFAYVLLLLPLFYYLKKQNNSKIKRALSVLMSTPGAPLLISLFFVIELSLLKPQIFALYAQTLHGFFYGFLAFFFGFLLVYSGESFWRTVLKWKWLYTVLALILYGIRFVLFGREAPGYLMAIESNCWIFGIFGFGHRYLNKPSKTLSYLSQAAYPVYIIHLFVLYAGALFILPLKIPILLKFICIVAFTGLVCYLIYEFIIRKIGFLRPLFGLKSKKLLKRINRNQININIMKKTLLILTLCGLTLIAKSQSTSVENSTFGIQTGVLGFWVYNEAKLSNTIALRTEVGFDFGIWETTFYDDYDSPFLLTPVIVLEPRFYYNLKKRSENSKRIDGNSGNFIALKMSYHPDSFVIFNTDNALVVSDFSIIPTWGIRRNIGKHFNFEAGIGAGYSYTFAERAGYLKDKSELELNMHLRIGYRF